MEKEKREKIGNNIRSKRVLAGLTQEQLAKMLNVSRCSIVNWESNPSLLTLERLDLMANQLNCTIDELIH